MGVVMPVVALGLLGLCLIGLFVKPPTQTSSEAVLKTTGLPIRLDVSLKDFKRVDLEGLAGVDFVFTVTNRSEEAVVIYPFVYGVSANGQPAVWPIPAFDSRGIVMGGKKLTPSTYTANWKKMLEVDLGRRFELKPGASDEMDGCVACKGKIRDSNCWITDLSLWVFDQDGKLILERQYRVK